MGICSPCLFYDADDHIWRFYVNDNGNLVYSIMYQDDKWTKETKIDKDVLDFKVNFDTDNKIYIIYSVRSSDLKYCVWEENKWFGKTIYSFENENYEMTELNVTNASKLIHIFFIGKNNIKKNQCLLMHFCLNKNENLFNIIDTIPFSKEYFCHYEVQYLENGDLSLIFINQVKNEVVINITAYKNNKWSTARRLYGVIGNNINFCTLLQLDKINILNLSNEGSLNFLEHVLIEPDGKMKSYKIHESSSKLSDFLLLQLSGVLYAIWAEGKNIFSSSFENKWSEPFLYYTELNNEISKYNFLSLSNKYNNLKCKYILGTNPPEINLLLPNVKNKEYRSDVPEVSKIEATIKLEPKSVKSKMDIEEELLVLQNINKNLEKKLIDLQIKYQQKVRIIEESDDNFLKLTNAKRKAEEKLNIIAEIQDTAVKKLEVLNLERISRDEIIDELKNHSLKLTTEYEGLKEQKISKDIAVNELKDKLQELTSEKEELMQHLNYEKNIGIVDRLLRKRPER